MQCDTFKIGKNDVNKIVSIHGIPGNWIGSGIVLGDGGVIYYNLLFVMSDPVMRCLHLYNG